MKKRHGKRVGGITPLKGQWKLPFEVPEKRHVRAEYPQVRRRELCHVSGGRWARAVLYAVWREGGKVRRKYLGRG